MKVNEVLTQDYRSKIYKDLDRWHYEGKIKLEIASDSTPRPVLFLYKFLGYKDVSDMLRNYTDKDAELVKKLAGPNGYTILKAILVRRSASNKTVES